MTDITTTLGDLDVGYPRPLTSMQAIQMNEEASQIKVQPWNIDGFSPYDALSIQGRTR